MVRINLLPVKTTKKKETAQQQIVIFVISVVGVLVACIAVYALTIVKISSAKDEISKSEDQIRILKGKIGEIDNLKNLQAEVRKKLDVLAQLRKEKTGPASRLARLSDSVPLRLWLTKYSENGPVIAIGGIAYNEELIAEFMRNLMSTGDFASVELLVSEQHDVAGVKTKRFELNCSLKSLKVDLPPSK